MDDEARTLVVTGASSGVGLAVAHALARRGHHLILLARGCEPLERAATHCTALGAASARACPLDVGDDAAVGRALDGVVGSHGHLDGVVSCAGVVAYGRLQDVPAQVFDGVVATNLLGSANLLRHALPHLRARRRGSVVLVGSLIGHIAVPTMSAYTASKWGVRALAREARVENRDVPALHVSYVSLPGVDTPIYRQGASAGGPAGRPPPVVWSPEQAADVVVRVLEHPRPETHGGALDAVARLGFLGLPGVYDAWVGPLFRRFATDEGHVVPPGPGNVLSSAPDGNALSGGHGSGARAALRSLIAADRPGDPR